MSDPEAESRSVPTGPQPQPARPLDPERKKKLILLGVAGAAVLLLVLVGNLAAKKRREAAASAPPPVTTSNAEPKPATDLLPLVSLGGQGKGGSPLTGTSEQELELESLARELKLLQARAAVVQARQNLADLRITPKAQEQRSLALEFAKREEAGRHAPDPDGPPPGTFSGHTRTAKSPSFAEVTVSKPADSPLPFVMRMGTLLDAVLVNKLVSDNATSPVMAMVDRPYYDPLTRKLLVPAGTRILGKAEAVKFQTASRLAVTFDTFQFPNGTTFTVKPDEQALEGLGIFGLQDSVNRHTARILFTAGLVGVLTGWNASQVQSGGAYGAYDGADMMRIQANNSMSKTGEQLLSPFLNAVPTITVNEGHRLKVWISRDIPMEAYQEAPNE